MTGLTEDWSSFILTGEELQDHVNVLARADLTFATDGERKAVARFYDRAYTLGLTIPAAEQNIRERIRRER